jgi:2-polyprenyl-6-methoxyphenol hydroxylase-like FAD-dependent oxidoreductase
MTMKKFDGTLIGTFPVGDPANPSLGIYRSKLHKCLYEYALSLNIPMEFDVGVARYFESQDEKLGGVVLSDGRTLTADLVIAADGVGSKSWEHRLWRTRSSQQNSAADAGIVGCCMLGLGRMWFLAWWGERFVG